MAPLSLIESDRFPFEFLSVLGERESWRKEIHRPVYYLHKWWAKRLGSVFRGILLGCQLDSDADLEGAFYANHDFSAARVFDPFMGSGTTIGEAHKLGLKALGRDINPVAVDAVRVALGPLNREKIEAAYRALSADVGDEIRALYQSVDSRGASCDVLYHFWVMSVPCPDCLVSVDLFSSFVFARNAYPTRKPEVHIVCPTCGDVFDGMHGEPIVTRSRGHRFDPESGPARGASADCTSCRSTFKVLKASGIARPTFRLYAKLVLTSNGSKEYLPATPADEAAYNACSSRLEAHKAELPTLALADGFNTRQAMGYGFRRWVDFFNDRQLLALVTLRRGIQRIRDQDARAALLTLFSGVLEFNNLFASYKGEGTGAVRHMFSHHILKPERTPIEAHVWGTSKSSGSFSNLYRSRLLRAIEYREAPTEVEPPGSACRRVCSAPFTGRIAPWSEDLPPRAIALSTGDSSNTSLADRCIDLVVTDPPFFDNVHYSELADFFRAWHRNGPSTTTRASGEVQDTDAQSFAEKLRGVLRECHRILKDDGLLVFSYHHSRAEGWTALAEAVMGAGFAVVNAHPVKAEMSVATPKTQAKEPIQLDIVLVCRKKLTEGRADDVADRAAAVRRAQEKIDRLVLAGFSLSQNDRRIVFHGQMLGTLRAPEEAASVEAVVEAALADQPVPAANDARAQPGGPSARAERSDDERQMLLLLD